MAEGYVMTIPQSVLNKLDQADAKIVKIAQNSEQARDRVRISFQAMADSIDPLLQKLEALKSLGNIKLDNTFKNSATAAEKAADSIAKVATQLNKINDSSTSSSSAKTSVLAWQSINENLKIQQARLDAVNRSIKEYENTLARINAGKGGTVSQADQTAYNANLQEAQAIQKTIAAYELKQQKIVALQQAQRQQLQYEEQIRNLAQGKKSFSEEKQAADLERLNEAFRTGQSELQKRAKLTDEYRRSVEAATKADEKRLNAVSKKADSQRGKEANEAAKAEEMYHRALAKTEVTITQRARKIEALTNAQRALNATGRDYSTQLSKIAYETQRLQKANDDAAKSTRRLKSEQNKIMDITGQLARQLSLLFSVSSIKGYVDKLVAVRGEFELQNRALQSILQNKDQANEIWDKTVQLAVRSPFTVKELVTYTKQLAAYRIEADKLYDTNKMLADVSAGLGVSMDRLILAFGQVKAANYLRASEVRQFTEAGVNILGELSAIYTELEGRMVSVAEVQERITKRMVKFGDVEEVFQRITSAGGIFYNMQEVQAETLAGMMSNLQDTFDIMFNDIGKANDGVLKGFVENLKNIVNNWQKIAQIAVPIISVLVLRWATLKAIILANSGVLGRFIKNFKLGFEVMGAQITRNSAAMGRLNTQLKKASMTKFGIWSTALSLVAIAGWEIYNAIKASREEQEKMNKTISDGVRTASEMSQKFKVLADTATDSTKSSQEQKAALDELERTYGDVVSAENLRIEKLKAMKGNYDSVTAAIYAKIEASTKEAMISQIQENQGEKANIALNNLTKSLIKFGVSSQTARDITKELQKAFDEGLINSERQASEKVKELIRNYTLLGDSIKEVEDNIGNLSSINQFIIKAQTAYIKMKSLKSAMEGVNNTEIKPFMIGDIPVARDMEAMLKDVSVKVESWEKDNENSLSIFDLSEGSRKKEIKYYQDFIDEIKKSLKGEGKLKLDERSFIVANKLIEEAQKNIDKIEGTTAQKEIEKLVKAAYELKQANLNDALKLYPDDAEGLEEYVKRVKNRLDYLKKEIIIFKKNALLSPFAADPQKLKDMQNEYKAVEYLLTTLPNFDKPKKGKSEADKRLERQLALLKEIGKAYKDNLKYYSKQDSMAKTRNDYANAAKEAGISDLVMSMSFDPSGIINGITEVGKKASSKMKLEIEKSIAAIRGEVNLDVRVKDIQDVKDEVEKVLSNYEITVSMSKAFPTIDREDLGKLFNFDTYTIEEAQDKINQLWIKKANERERIVAASEGRIARTYETGAAAASSLGTEGVQRYNENMKKITDAQSKELETRLKRFGEYLNKSLDLQKAVQQEANQDLLQAGELFQKGKINAQQYATIVKNVTDEANSKIGKINIDKFKDSPDYIKMIGDTSQYSKKELQELIDKMQEFISLNAGNMDSQQLKSLMDDMDKIRKNMDEIDEKNPFNQSLFAQIKKMKQARKEYNQELENNKRLAKEAAQAEKELAEAQARAKQTQVQHSTSVDASSKDEMAAAGEQVNIATENLNKANGALKQSNGALGQASSKLKGIEGKMGGAMGMVDKIVTGIYQSINATIELMNQFKELAESNGVDTSKGGWREAAQAGEVLGNVNEKVMSSWNNFKSGNFAGAITDAVGSITTIFTTLNKQHDARREQKIQDEIKMVNKLSMAYEHLARKMENAYTIDTLNMSYENAERNIEQQIQSYKNMIAAEKDKKDVDQDRIDEWNNEIQKQYEALEDLKASKLQELGGFGSGSAMADAAQEFASAWMEAYMETGDGLDALNDKWDEFIQNIVVKQLALRGVSKFLEPIMKQIDAAIGNDSYLSTDELEKIKSSVEEMNPKLNAYFKDIMEGFGNLLPQPGSASELSGLQTGIQGISEQQADVIEAYLNSMRFFVADTNMQIQKLALFFSADPAQNPMYSELMSQTRLLRSIDDRLASVITSAGNHPLSGFAIKSII